MLPAGPRQSLPTATSPSAVMRAWAMRAVCTQQLARCARKESGTPLANSSGCRAPLGGRRRLHKPCGAAVDARGENRSPRGRAQRGPRSMDRDAARRSGHREPGHEVSFTVLEAGGSMSSLSSLNARRHRWDGSSVAGQAAHGSRPTRPWFYSIAGLLLWPSLGSSQGCTRIDPGSGEAGAPPTLRFPAAPPTR